MDTDNRQTEASTFASASTSASTGAADAASSLRAAALLSRKRRKVASETPAPLPLRPAPEPIFQLDYGQDDSSTSPAQAPQTEKKKQSPEARSTPSLPAPTSQMEDIEDGQIREEGEISDTEISPAPPSQRRSPASPPRTRQRASTTQSHPSEAPKGDMPPPLLFIESARVSPSKPSDIHAWQEGNIASVEPFVLETSTYRVDANHVRPGLAMTQDQFNTAKDIVLDLLGWGVSPEHLLECGSSRHVIFYVFTELNLRLPSNLDISGLIPYPTPEMLALMPVPPSLLHPLSSAMPPPSVIPARGSLAGRMGIERIDSDMPSPDQSPYTKSESSPPSTADLSTSLHMIEQQRRQELLARKAVIASRKARQSDSACLNSHSKDQDVDMVAPQSVDDFLKTIEPAPHLGAGDNDDDNQVSSVGTARFLSPTRMDGDGPIPDLIGASANTSILAGPSSAQSISSTSTVTYAEPSSPGTLPPGWTMDADSFRSDSAQHDSSTSLDVVGSLAPIVQANSSYSNFDGDGGHPSRRGTKRPVAADFVDFDSGPGSSRGYSNGGSYPNPLTRRKTGSFAGISGMRRCVIELSDSEDDGDGQVRGEYVGNGDGREYSPGVTPGSSARYPPRLTATPTMSSTIGFVNGSAGQSTLPNTFTSTIGFGALSPAALVEKEEEIKKMRQLIAQREELRLKKLAAMSGKSMLVIPPSTEAPTPATTVIVKQEETPITSPSIMDFMTTHDISVVGDRSPRSLRITDDLATTPTPGSPVLTDDRDDSSAQETSTIGHEISSQDGDSEDEDLMVTGEAHSAQVVPSLSVEFLQESSAASDSGTSLSAQVLQYQLSQSQNEAPVQSSGPSFSSYDSPLARYPLLRSRCGPETRASDSSLVAGYLLSELAAVSQPSTGFSTPNVHSSSPISFTLRPGLSVSSHSSSPIPCPDLKPLKQAVLHRTLALRIARSVGLRVCQYEVPGGGVCHDNDCEELHLSRIASEPNGTSWHYSFFKLTDGIPTIPDLHGFLLLSFQFAGFPDTEVATYVHGTLPHPWSGRCDVHAIEIALEGVRLRGGIKDVDARVWEALAGLGIPII